MYLQHSGQVFVHCHMGRQHGVVVVVLIAVSVLDFQGLRPFSLPPNLEDLMLHCTAARM